MPRGRLGDEAADAGRAGEIDAADRRIGDERLDDAGGVGRRIADDIDDAVAEPGVAQRLADQAMGLGAELGAFQDDGVAAGERHRQRPDAENDGGVPRRDAQDDAGRLAKGESGEAGARPTG